MQQQRFDFWIDLNEKQEDGTFKRFSKASHIMAESLEEARKKARKEISANNPNSIIISITP